MSLNVLYGKKKTEVGKLEVRRYGADRTRRLKAWGFLKYKNLATNIPPFKGGYYMKNS